MSNGQIPHLPTVDVNQFFAIMSFWIYNHNV